MNLELIRTAIATPTEQAIDALLEDGDTVIWVDWREAEEDIVDYCEDKLQTGTPNCECVDADNDAGFELFIEYQANRQRIPLVHGPEDRHIAIHAMNQILGPDYEIRLCIDSWGSDTLGFVALAGDTWRSLESAFGEAVGKRFYRLAASPNVFTDPLRFD